MTFRKIINFDRVAKSPFGAFAPLKNEKCHFRFPHKSMKHLQTSLYRVSLVRIFKLLLSIFYYLILRVRRAIWGILGLKVSPALVNVTYHSIGDDDVDRFVGQMEVLLKYGVVVSVNSLSREMGSSIRVVVTFDDAFENFFSNALPVLTHMEIPAIVFVPAALLSQNPRWIEDENPNAQEKIMSTEQLLDLPFEMIMVGSHTLTHPRLSFLDGEGIKREVVESKTSLEKILRRPIDFLSFPYGDYDNRVMEISKRAGYRHVYLNTPARFLARDTDFLQGRVNVEPDDWPLEFYLKIVGAYQWLALAIPLKRKIFGYSWKNLPDPDCEL